MPPVDSFNEIEFMITCIKHAFTKKIHVNVIAKRNSGPN